MGTETAATLTHLDAEGTARMVDVGGKTETERVAVATSAVTMAPETLRLIVAQALPKGDVLTVARIAGIQAAKRTADLIPLCHPLMLSHVEVTLVPDATLPGLTIRATVRCHGRTGVEMEALTAASVAGLTIYDMAKAVDRGMTLGPLRVVEKRGGKSGDWTATSA